MTQTAAGLFDFDLGSVEIIMTVAVKRAEPDRATKKEKS